MTSEKPSGSDSTEISVDTIVHLGAGRCSELSDYIALNPSRLILVEADPHQAAALKDQLAGMDGIEVIEQAVGGLPGLREFRRYNQPDLSSLHAASPALLELFPGLRTLEKFEVEVIAPEKLLETLAIDESGNNRLVMDLPGEEFSALESLQKADYLRLFEQIQCYCGREPFYEEGVTASGVLNLLREQGYDLIGEDISHDPDRPNWILKRNRFQIQVRQFEEQILGLTADRDALRARLNEQDQVIDSLGKAREEDAKRIAAFQQEIAQAEEALEDRNNKLSQYQEQLERLKAELDERLKILADREEQLEAQNEQLERTTHELNELRNQLGEVNQARDADRELATERQTELEQLKMNRDKYKQLADERAEQVGRFQSQVHELEIRNDLLTEEMAKAEGQVDLLKDVLLREPGI